MKAEQYNLPMTKNLNLLQRFFLKLIRLYQKFFSFDHGYLKIFFPGGYCQYRPSCSDYMALAIIKHGAIKGLLKGIKRILRCHPWSKGGLDLP